MNYPHSIPLWRTNGELLPGNALSRVVLSSVCTKWNDIVLEQHHFPSRELTDVMFKWHVIVINIGHSVTEFEKDGQFQGGQRARGAVTFLPSHQPFSCQLKVVSGMSANFLYLALNPVLVGRVAEGLQLDADRIKLTERRGIIDPTVRHIALALWARVQSDGALDRMYGEALSTALAVHLLREYGAAVVGAKRQF